MRVLRLLLLMIVAMHVSTSWAQQSSTRSEGPQETVDDVRTKYNELPKQPIREKEALLLRELDRIDAEISNSISQRNFANSFKDTKATFNNLIDRVSRQTRIIASFDCENDSSKFRDAGQLFFREYTRLVNFWRDPPETLNVDYGSIALPSPRGVVEDCAEAKTKFSSSEYSAAFRQLSETLEKALTEYVANQASLGAEYTRYIDALKERRNIVQDKLNASQSASQIGSNLPLLLLILATACVATILGVKLFDVELQMEWVASGQVIQFVTVMILLSVILALGLSGILKENTLGTLLGGVAGYVLAQGVGRAAARDVARSRPLPPLPSHPSVPPPAAPPAPPPAAPPAPPPTAPPASRPRRGTGTETVKSRPSRTSRS